MYAYVYTTCTSVRNKNNMSIELYLLYIIYIIYIYMYEYSSILESFEILIEKLRSCIVLTWGSLKMKFSLIKMVFMNFFCIPSSDKPT